MWHKQKRKKEKKFHYSHQWFPIRQEDYRKICSPKWIMTSNVQIFLFFFTHWFLLCIFLMLLVLSFICWWKTIFHFVYCRSFRQRIKTNESKQYDGNNKVNEYKEKYKQKAHTHILLSDEVKRGKKLFFDPVLRTFPQLK